MMRGMYSAISGLKNHQIALDVTANDLANVNTIGYKGARTTFQDSLTQMQKAGSSFNQGFGGANPAQVGLGASLGSITNQMGGGAFQATGNPLDVGIQGEGWFRVAAGDPTAGPGSINDMQFTRAGNFTTNNAGYMITQDGRYVVGRTAQTGGTDTFMQITPGGTDVAVGADGAVTFIPPGGGARATAGYLQLAQFGNESGLERVNANRWKATGASGNENVGGAGTGNT